MTSISPALIFTDSDFAELLHIANSQENNDGDDNASPQYIPLEVSGISTSAACKMAHPAASLHTISSATQTAQTRQHKRRTASRKTEVMVSGYKLSPKQRKKQLTKIKAVTTALATDSLPVANGARTALKKPAPESPKKVPEIQNLIDNEGFQYIPCGENGIPSKIQQPILDSQGRVIAIIAASPDESKRDLSEEKQISYDEAAMDLFNVILEESESNAFTKKELNHKRGNFPAINFGFTLPPGPFEHPINLDTSRHDEKIDRITSCPGFERISAFQNSSFASWNPGVYNYQKSRIEQLLAHDKTLKRTSETTIFPTTACNFRNVCCYKHRDTENLAYGWCAITALGRFDHTRGGHLILWELKLIIEFPHGYTILIPSATITHSNIPVSDGDVRVSITQYCAGSVLRYVDNGFRLDMVLEKEDKQRFDEAHTLKKDMWRLSLGLLSTLEDLKKGRTPFVKEFQ